MEIKMTKEEYQECLISAYQLNQNLLNFMGDAFPVLAGDNRTAQYCQVTKFAKYIVNEYIPSSMTFSSPCAMVSHIMCIDTYYLKAWMEDFVARGTNDDDVYETCLARIDELLEKYFPEEA